MSSDDTPTAEKDTILLERRPRSRPPGAVDSPTSRAAPPESSSQLLERGQCIGRYVVMDVIGQGGMAVVYNAYDPDLDRRVALKLVRVRAHRKGDMATARAQARLVREAQALARLNHPNVVTVHDVGSFGRDVFLAMEFVAGQTLKDWLAGERTQRGIIATFVAAGRGLGAAHRAGIVHRDFKPGNVLVGEDGTVRVADFGLARATDDGRGDSLGDDSLDDSSDDGTREASESGEHSERRSVERPRTISGERSSLTIAGSVLGTPAYMAPEQHHGIPVDARSDQFSFCVALYEALYGTRPFSGDDVAELRSRVTSGELDEPPRSARVPARLRRLLLRGLAVHPADRFPSMDALLAELDRDPRARRRRVLVPAAVIGLTAVAAVGLLRGPGAGGALCQDAAGQLARAWDDAREERVRARFLAAEKPYARDLYTQVARLIDDYATRWRAMYTEACEATHVRGEQSAALLDLRMRCLRRQLGKLDALTALFADAEDDEILDNAVPAALALPDVAMCGDEAALTAVVPPPADPEVRAKVEGLMVELDRVEALFDAGQYRAGVDLGEDIARRARATEHPPLVARALTTLGALQHLSGDAQAAVTTHGEAAKAAASARDDSLIADAMLAEAFVLTNDLSQHDAALELTKRAEVAVIRAGDPPEQRAELLKITGDVLRNKARFAESRSYLERALALREQLHGRVDYRVGMVLNNLGITANEMQDHAASVAYYERALAIWKEMFGPEHPHVATTLNNLGAAANDLGEWGEAARYYEEALAIWRRTVGPEHPYTATTLNNLGSVASGTGDHRRAMDHFNQVLALQEAIFGEEHGELVLVLLNLAMTSISLGEHQPARAYVDRALRISESSFGADHPMTAIGWRTLGSVLVELGDPEARGYLERALPVLEQAYGDHPLVARTRELLGLALALAGKPRDAARELERALAGFEHAYSASHVDIANAQVSYGRLLIAQGRADDALPLLERALASLTELGYTGHRLWSRARFACARALWDTAGRQPATRREARGRAIALARQARQDLAELDQQHDADREAIVRWLQPRRGTW